MNRRTFLTGLLASGAAISTTSSVVRVLSPDWRNGFTPIGKAVYFGGRKFWISGPQTVSWAHVDDAENWITY